AEGLIGMAGAIDDAQSPVAERDMIIDEFTSRIGTAMRAGIGHQLDRRTRIIELLQPEYACDPTHQRAIGTPARMRSRPSRNGIGSRPSNSRMRVISGILRVISPSSSGGRCTIFDRLSVMSMIISASALIVI